MQPGARLAAAGVNVSDTYAVDTASASRRAWRSRRDVDASTIPQEAVLEVDAVSFTKGCFLGQELVCRIDTRGHVNRFLRASPPWTATARSSVPSWSPARRWSARSHERRRRRGPRDDPARDRARDAVQLGRDGDGDAQAVGGRVEALPGTD